ncbi:aldolase [halophilic archaeon]|nr:aldolase [halophilic archaeon]
MTNELKESIRAYEYPAGTWVSIGHPTVAEVSAMSAFDFVLVDTEHTAMHLETVENLVRAVDAVQEPTATVVRVPWNDAVRLKRVLDIGVDGVMVPMVETADEARELVRAVRYPPDGIRGVASGRASGYGRDFEEYVRTADGTNLTIVQIETEAGLENAEAIAAVDGVDALFVGPADLSCSLGVFSEWESTGLADAMKRVIEAGHRSNTPVGTLTVDPDDVETRLEQGFDFLIVGKDTSHLRTANREAKELYDRTVSRIGETESGGRD